MKTKNKRVPKTLLSAAALLLALAPVSYAATVTPVFTGDATAAENVLLKAAISTYATTPTDANYQLLLDAIQASRAAGSTVLPTTTPNDGDISTKISTSTNQAGSIHLNSPSNPDSTVKFHFQNQAQAISAGANSLLVLTADSGAKYSFHDNSTSGAGAALASSSTNSFLFINNAEFLNNKLTSNAANRNGGAIFLVDSNKIAVLTNVEFTGNQTYYGTSTVGGGAIYFSGNSSILTITNAIFTGNTSGSNSISTSGGGAIFAGTGVTNLINVDFYGNSVSNATNSGGGAILITGGGTVNLFVPEGGTNTFSGNTGLHGAAFCLSTGTLNINTPATSVLDMRDPFGAFRLNATLNKNGDGIWKLGGDSVLSNSGGSGTVNININEGTLYLYRAGEVSDTYGDVVAGSITDNSTIAAFTLGTDATLSVGGRNTIMTWKIILQEASTLAFDLAHASKNLGNTAPDSTTAALTLNSVGSLFTVGDNIHIDLLSLNEEIGTYTLIYLTQGGDKFNGKLDADVTLRGESLSLTRLNGAVVASATGVVLTEVKHAVVSWTNGADDTWNISADNWTGQTSAGVAVVKFLDGDIVNFDGTEGGDGTGAIAIYEGGIRTVGMNFSGDGSYTFTGGAVEVTARNTEFNGTAANGKLTLGAKASNTLDTATLASVPFTGTVEIAGAGENVFAGGVDVFGGTLRVGEGAELVLGADSDLAVSAAGTLAVSATSRVTTAEAGGVVFEAGALLVMGISTEEAYGQILSDAVDVTGAKLVLDLGAGFVGEQGMVFDLFRGVDGNEHAVTGDFGFPIEDSKGRYEWSFDAATGQVTLTGVIVPEPGTYGFIGAVGVLVLALIRRRKNKNKKEK